MLRSGIPWEYLPQEMGCGSGMTCWRRPRDWQNAGVNEAVVQKLAGHASVSTTLKYYTRIMPEALRIAQARLPFVEVLRGVSYTYHGLSQTAELLDA